MVYYELVVSVIVMKIVYEVDLENKVGCMLVVGVYYLYICNFEDVWVFRKLD